MPEKVRVGFIGAGNVSGFHARGLASCERAELVGLWSLGEDSGAKAREFGCREYASVEELLSDSIDAVFVLTNLETHFEFASRALEAGKHVLVEKPVGVNVEEIRLLRATAQAAGKLCVPGHNYIHDPSLQRTRDLIARGKLGDLVAIYVLYNIAHPESAAAGYPGVIPQIMTHHAYITSYLAGPVGQVSAMSARRLHLKLDQEDTAMAILQLESGALAHFEASFAADDHSSDPWTMLVKVIGTKGSTRYSYRDWVELEPAGFHSQTYSAYSASIESEVSHFIEACVLGGADPLSTLDDAIEAQRVVDACAISAREGVRVELNKE